MRNLKWTVGDVEIYQIIELEDAGKVIQSTIKNATPQNIRKISWLYPDFADKEGNLKSLVQSFLIKSGEKNILIDTCNGNGKTRSDLPEWGNLHTDFLKRLRSIGIIETDINMVVSTHLHCDHIGWNTIRKGGSWVPTFPNARYLFVKKEFEYWKGKPEKEMAADKLAFDDSVSPVIKAGLGEIVTAHQRIDPHLRLRPTPGHTPGHVSVVVESKGRRAIISGDFIHHPCQIAHPEWTIDADVLPDQALATRQKILAEIADTDTLLIGSHFANPVAGFVSRAKDGYIFKQKKSR